MRSLSQLFRHKNCNIIGMLHLPALPGTPASSCSIKEIMEKVEEETRIYLESGVDGLILENMHDTPYCLARDLEPHITATMAVLASRVRNLVRDSSVPVGVQVLAGGNREAVAVAQAAGLQFVRAEGFVFSHVADEGWLEGCAGPLLRYRANIGAGEVRVLCDIKKKHSAHSVTADVSIAETARAAGFFRADGVIVTGGSTGDPADTRELEQVREAVPSLPVLVGSGVRAENLRSYSRATAAIIGSEFKRDGWWENELCPDRIRAVMDEAKRLR